jgi:hypothetical protein
VERFESNPTGGALRIAVWEQGLSFVDNAEVTYWKKP